MSVWSTSPMCYALCAGSVANIPDASYAECVDSGFGRRVRVSRFSSTGVTNNPAEAPGVFAPAGAVLHAAQPDHRRALPNDARRPNAAGNFRPSMAFSARTSRASTPASGRIVPVSTRPHRHPRRLGQHQQRRASSQSPRGFVHSAGGRQRPVPQRRHRLRHVEPHRRQSGRAEAQRFFNGEIGRSRNRAWGRRGSRETMERPMSPA